MYKLSELTSNKELLSGNYTGKEIVVGGWIKTHRRSKKVAFIQIDDGTSIEDLQLVIDPKLPSYVRNEDSLTTGSSIEAKGVVVESPAKGQKYELNVSDIELIGTADPESYPLQKKGHSLEFLREISHLRPRSKTFGAVFRVRSKASMAVHSFFQKRGFIYLTAPIITTSDCEGAGEMFTVTTLNLDNIQKINGNVDYSEDFFKERAGLTVSGQLEAEAFALGLSKVYTFGPTFRAENSNTTRHLAEFWMIEPEIAFADLEEDMALAESFIKDITKYILNECSEDLAFLHSREWVKDGDKIKDMLLKIIDMPFEVIPYTQAIEALEKSGRDFEYSVYWGMDLQAEHEKYLTDEYVKAPVFIINYPKDIKAFYMRLNSDNKTVAAMDLLFPKLGEIIGGSQREEREDVLKQRMIEFGLNPQDYQWYLDLRRFGSVPHAGFGLGFERYLQYVTGMGNIRDVIPFYRCPGWAKF